MPPSSPNQQRASARNQPRRASLGNRLLPLELPRVALESLALAASWPSLVCSAPRSDGHPVLVMPGFTASDTSTGPLRRHLSLLGYRALPWELGTNTGRRELQDRLVQRFLDISEQYQVPVSLVGHSLGGVFARELARRFPDRVRLVVTLGSPFAMGRSQGQSEVARQLFRYLSRSNPGASQLSGARAVPPVPCTSIYSRTDGVVAWRNCLELASSQTENIEVYSSHIGMAVQPSVWFAVADRLQYKASNWQPFRPKAERLCLAYPEPVYPGSLSPNG